MTPDPQAAAPPLISVVICTLDRPELLHNVLETLAAQSFEPERFEVIVVDNGPHQGTREAFDKVRPRLGRARYVVERSKGLSHARNRGWREAEGEWIAYSDDDCELPQSWLSVADETIREIGPDVFGGPYYPFYLSPKPAWFKDSYGSGGILRDAAGTVNRNLRGGNLFIRRSLLGSLEGFRPEYGMAGAALAYGDETELQDRLRRERPETVFYYEPQLAVKHLVRPEKMNLRWLIRSAFAKGRSGERVRRLRADSPPVYSKPHLLLDGARTLLALPVDLLRAVFVRDRSRFPHLRSYLQEETYRYLHRLGKLAARWQDAGSHRS